MCSYSPSTTAPTESCSRFSARPKRVAREFEHFAVHRVGQAVDAHDAVGHGHDRADVARFGGARELLDARLDQIADFGGFDCHGLY